MIQTDRQILRIALPSIVSNITVPLLGLVDLAIVGHLGNAVYIGAIAVGSMIFNVIYWVFGFLRMGTSGMTSQALGNRNLAEVLRILVRSMTVGLMVAAVILFFQSSVRSAAFLIIRPTADIRAAASSYFDICVWGAPAMLGLYSLSGWFIGMQNTRIPMFISIMQNIVNIAASLTLVFVVGMKVEGVATGTLIAQYAGLAVGVLLLLHYYGRLGRYWNMTGVFLRSALWRFFRVNGDIFVRTLFIVSVNFYFLSAGAAQGKILLAVNTLLMQLFTLFSYVMDGFAYAGEALCGRYYGAGNKPAFRLAIRRLFVWGVWLTVGYTVVYALGGQPFLRLLTDNESVIAASASYLPWAVAIPAAGVAAFVWDGVFIGITATHYMLIASVIAAVTFFLLYFSLFPIWGNHALWLAFIVYLFMRGAVQSVMMTVSRIWR